MYNFPNTKVLQPPFYQKHSTIEQWGAKEAKIYMVYDVFY